MKPVVIRCLLACLCLALPSCRQPAEPVKVEIPKGFVAVTDEQVQFIEKVKALSVGTSLAEVKRVLGRPAEETPTSLFYNVVEGAEGGYYVTARLVFGDCGLSTATLGFGHVSLVPADE